MIGAFRWLVLVAVGSLSATSQAPLPERIQTLRAQLDTGHANEVVAAAGSVLGEARAAYAAQPDDTGAVVLADALDLLVNALWSGGRRRDPQTLTLAVEVVALRCRVLGERHPSVAESRRRLGSIYETAQRFEEAQREIDLALSIASETTGPGGLLRARVLDNASALADDRNQPELGLALSLESLAIRERELGDSEAVSDSLSSTGNMYYALGRLSEAEATYSRAVAVSLAIASPTAGHTRWGDPVDASLQRALHNLALTRQGLGDIEGAFGTYERSLALSETLYGGNHHRTGSDHVDMGRLFHETGDFAEARAHYEKARDSLGSGYGMNHPEYASALGRLGLLARDEGDLASAESLETQALGIITASLGEEHVLAAAAMLELGETLVLAGETARAGALLGRAVSILRRTAPGGAELPAALLGLAELAAQRGADDVARTNAEAGLAAARALNPDHPLIARALLLLGELDGHHGQAASALAAFAAADALVQRTLGSDHPKRAEIQLATACTLAASDPTAALELAVTASSIWRRQVAAGVETLSERQGLLFVAAQRRGQDLALRLLASMKVSSPAQRRAVWDEVAGSRGKVLESLAARRRLLAASSDPETQRLQVAWSAARRRHAGLLVAAAGDLPVATSSRLLREAAEHAEQLEVDLARRVDPAHVGRGEIDIDQALATLPPLSTLVAFERFGTGACPGPVRTAANEEAHYGAFVGSSTDRATSFVDLGPAGPIDRLVGELGASLARAGLPGEEVHYARAGAALRKLVFDPLDRALAKSRALYVVGAGELGLIDLATLPDRGGGYLIERRMIFHQRIAERRLLADHEPAASGLFALGDPAFDAPLHGRTAEAAVDPGVTEALTVASAASTTRSLERCGWFSQHRFSSLPATREEVEDVGLRFARHLDHGRDQILLGAAATEDAFNRLAPGHRFLHLATHGFFADVACENRGAAPTRESLLPGLATPLSGLALAGANLRQGVRTEGGDGILTAAEVATVDLGGTELVVLSACSSGVGETSAGEGVLGLRRAFHVAGARQVVVSLGPVDDRVARDWMKGFYAILLGSKPSVPEAARTTSLETLRARRRNGLSTHPAFWAPFVVSEI